MSALSRERFQAFVADTANLREAILVERMWTTRTGNKPIIVDSLSREMIVAAIAENKQDKVIGYMVRMWGIRHGYSATQLIELGAYVPGIIGGYPLTRGEFDHYFPLMPHIACGNGNLRKYFAEMLRSECYQYAASVVDIDALRRSGKKIMCYNIDDFRGSYADLIALSQLMHRPGRFWQMADYLDWHSCRQWTLEEMCQNRDEYRWTPEAYAHSRDYTVEQYLSVVDNITPQALNMVCEYATDSAANIIAFAARHGCVGAYILFNEHVSGAEIRTHVDSLDDPVKFMQLMLAALTHCYKFYGLLHKISRDKIRALQSYDPTGILLCFDDYVDPATRLKLSGITQDSAEVRDYIWHENHHRNAADVFALAVFMCDEVIALDGHFTVHTRVNYDIRARADDEPRITLRTPLNVVPSSALAQTWSAVGCQRRRCAIV